MIADENDLVTSQGPLTVRVQHGTRYYSGVSALLDGDGTPKHPLHFVLMACHADAADEELIATSQQFTSALAERVLAGLRSEEIEIRDVLRAANVAAAATDRYYSIVAGRVVQRSVTIGTLGGVDANVLRGNSCMPVTTPNVVRIGEHVILDGVFGIGFKEEALHTTQLHLAADAALLVIIGHRTARICSTSRDRSAAALIEDVRAAAGISPPIIAVVH
jgi:hypothetical protein